MSDEFGPHNELERQLVAAQEGDIPAEEFIGMLLGSEVFMPVHEKHQIGGLQLDTVAQPLKLQDEEGREVLVLFTSPDRAKAFVSNFPGYGGGLVTEFAWILEKMGVEFGITLNPGEPYGMEFEAQDLAQLAALHKLS